MRAVAGERAAQWRDLDLPQDRQSAMADPVGFVAFDGLTVIDEIQRAPELLLAIKATVDADPRPGRFLLTGSSRLLALRGPPDTLPGRMGTIELWPFSPGEIDGAPDGFVDAAFRAGPDMRYESAVSRAEYADRVVRGGLPEAVARADPQLVAAGSLETELQISRPTIARYLSLLEEVFLIKRVPGWSRNLGTRATATTKLVFVDSGVASRLLAADAHTLRRPGSLFGPLLEGFVIAELARQLSWAEEQVDIYHYRDHDKVEVDVVLENGRGQVVGVEVRASSTVRADDFRGLRRLADRLGDDFLVGVVLYTGTATLPFGPKLRAMPVSALWQLGSARLVWASRLSQDVVSG